LVGELLCSPSISELGRSPLCLPPPFGQPSLGGFGDPPWVLSDDQENGLSVCPSRQSLFLSGPPFPFTRMLGLLSVRREMGLCPVSFSFPPPPAHRTPPPWYLEVLDFWRVCVLSGLHRWQPSSVLSIFFTYWSLGTVWFFV